MWGHLGRSSCSPSEEGFWVGLGHRGAGVGRRSRRSDGSDGADGSRQREGHVQRPRGGSGREVCENVRETSMTEAECVRGSEVQSWAGEAARSPWMEAT